MNTNSTKVLVMVNAPHIKAQNHAYNMIERLGGQVTNLVPKPDTFMLHVLIERKMVYDLIVGIGVGSHEARVSSIHTLPIDIEANQYRIVCWLQDWKTIGRSFYIEKMVYRRRFLFFKGKAYWQPIDETEKGKNYRVYNSLDEAFAALARHQSKYGFTKT